MDLAPFCGLLILLRILSVVGRPTMESDDNLDLLELAMEQDGRSFYYRTKDGQTRDETVRWSDGKLVISGWYRYIGPDGVAYQVRYVADENGYRPLGMHLPGANLSDPSAFNILTPLAVGISRTVLLSLVG
ncbi:larval cuticle protein 65Ag1-like [Anopheles bellator]|uniref:larval cuticle protein 65Ag1-like n=1 Tax=Anopheles bellator TaxID=139047 RepID=UPI00264790BB|nr:larval cuticle protein 65Ag1-like [Anopheles bellator]